MCSQVLLQQPTRLATALDSGLSATVVRLLNNLTGEQVEHLAEDGTSWVDECGRVFVADHGVAPSQQVTADVAPRESVPADVFSLASRPGSTRTIYLDFDGATYSGTRWKNGAEIVSPAYSIDADRTTFNDVERAQIYLAWRTVAEDYAPFDVNVTTLRPDPSALSRTTSTDPTYGMPVVISPTNSVGSGCGCGGLSYVGIFGTVNATDHQPAWIFTNGSGTGGYNMGQIISHEVGHTFGLSHDGTSQASYYSGAKGWGPIMGASYDRRASHWSSGEYADANNAEDDTAVIARTAPVVADDHAGSALGATRLTAGTPVAGTITTRTDTDAFSFSAYGRTALTVAGPAGFSNLDVRLTILSSLGTTVATVDPTADVADDASMARHLAGRPARHRRDVHRRRRRHRLRCRLRGRALQRLRLPRRVRRLPGDRRQHRHTADDVDHHHHLDPRPVVAIDRLRDDAAAACARRLRLPRGHPVPRPGVGGARRLAAAARAEVEGRRRPDRDPRPGAGLVGRQVRDGAVRPERLGPSGVPPRRALGACDS